MGWIIGVTGTPGTGKKTVSPILAGLLGVHAYGLNEMAAKLGATGPGDSEVEVDTAVLRAGLRASVGERAVVYGHLLPEVLETSDVEAVVVLRCDPRVLKARLVARGYEWPKVLENVEAELIGVVSSRSRERFGEKSLEFDSTSGGGDALARAIARAVREGKAGEPLDWLADYDTAGALRSLLSP